MSRRSLTMMFSKIGYDLYEPTLGYFDAGTGTFLKKTDAEPYFRRCVFIPCEKDHQYVISTGSYLTTKRVGYTNYEPSDFLQDRLGYIDNATGYPSSTEITVQGDDHKYIIVQLGINSDLTNGTVWMTTFLSQVKIYEI